MDWLPGAGRVLKEEQLLNATKYFSCAFCVGIRQYCKAMKFFVVALPFKVREIVQKL